MNSPHETSPNPKAPYGITRPAIGPGLENICDSIAAEADQYRESTLYTPNNPDGQVPRLFTCRIGDFRRAGIEMPRGFLCRPEVQQALREEVPSIAKGIGVTATSLFVYGSKPRNISEIAIKFSKDDYRKINEEKDAIRKILVKMMGLPRSALNSIPSYSPTIQILVASSSAETFISMNKMKQEISGENLPFALTLQPAELPEIKSAPKPNRKRPVEVKKKQTPEELEIMLKDAGLLRSDPIKPSRSRRRPPKKGTAHKNAKKARRTYY